MLQGSAFQLTSWLMTAIAECWQYFLSRPDNGQFTRTRTYWRNLRRALIELDVDKEPAYCTYLENRQNSASAN